MKIKSSKHMLAFYKECLAWAEGGGGIRYNNRWGLCNCVNAYEHCVRGSFIRVELLRQFGMASLDPWHPFGKAEYARDAANGTMHEDPNRLAWVRARIADMEDGK